MECNLTHGANLYVCMYVCMYVRTYVCCVKNNNIAIDIVIMHRILFIHQSEKYIN